MISDQEILEIVNRVSEEFVGQFNELEGAVGMLLLGRQYGWKVMLLIHDRKTIKKYERILGINVREIFPEVGPLAHKSIGWTLVQKVSSFWKAVKGEIPGIKSQEIQQLPN